MDLREVPSTTFRRHPWETARAAFFLRLLAQHQRLAERLDVVDVGAGDGFVAGELLRAAPPGTTVTCCDLNYTDEQLRDLPTRVPGVAFARTPPAQAADLLLLLDVIEHVADDVGLLRDLAGTVLRPGGHVLVSVPAWMALFSRHDLGVLHHRRYEPAGLRRVVKDAGLTIVAHGGLFHGLLLPRIGKKLGELARGVRAKPEPDADHPAETEIAGWTAGRALTGAVRAALALDNAASLLFGRMRLDVPGLSAWILARR